MAVILPTDWKNTEASGSAARQMDTLAMFERGLGDEITVYHGVHWSRPHHGLGSLGDVDFVVMSAGGSILLVEQKAGFLNESEQGLVKRYRGSHRFIRIEIDRTVDSLRKRLSGLRAEQAVSVQYLLYCPDYTVKDRSTAGLDPSQIIDSSDRDQLCNRITELLSEQVQQPELVRRLHHFFANELELVPDASALVGRANALVTRLSEGLATWARRFEVHPPRLRVVATAGSGKTQLALALLAQASAAKQSALYICFNRPLADHIRASAPHDAQVFNYHQWCQHRLRAAGEDLSFDGGSSFEQLERRSIKLPVSTAESVDMLIVDEGQDFSVQWRDDILRLATVREPEQAQIWWLEDPMQNLYNRESGTPPDWPTLRAQVNYRSPRAVVDWVNQLLGPPMPVIASGPVQGVAPEILVYDDDAALVTQTKVAVTTALRAGFRREDIAIITFSGRARSVIHPLKSLGPNQLRKFSGKYDLFGEPEILEGELLLDTVFRFKGQSAPCVILTEVAFTELDEIARRKLFVGVTRASLHTIIVCHRHSASMLGEK
ncbi:MAG: ATP-binding domain-containing protein [Burkholderiaceae bacterium]